MHYFECMCALRILGRPGQTQVLSPCRVTPHPAYMATQDTQKKRLMESLGAQIARLRQQQGMNKQEDLHLASGVGVRTISDIETGKKVPRVGTMRKLESALNLEPGSTDDFLAGKITKLEPTHDGAEADLYARVVRDDVEAEMLNIRGVSKQERWEYVFDRRRRLAEGRAPGAATLAHGLREG